MAPPTVKHTGRFSEQFPTTKAGALAMIAFMVDWGGLGYEEIATSVDYDDDGNPVDADIIGAMLASLTTFLAQPGAGLN